MHSTEYDLVVLDLGLPDVDGLQVLGKIRNRKVIPPVLILSARDSVDDRVKGLEQGADDYLVKPFALPELLARIRSIQRRGLERLPLSLRVADLEIDLLNHTASRGGVALHLTPKEFALLALMARHAGEVLGRRQIARQVWNLEFDGGSNVVDVAVKRLRRKVDLPSMRPLIRSVYGVGYVLEGS